MSRSGQVLGGQLKGSERQPQIHRHTETHCTTEPARMKWCVIDGCFGSSAGQTNKQNVHTGSTIQWVKYLKIGEAASHGRWEWYFGCFSLNSLWFIEQLGARQLRRNFMSVCVTEQVGPRLYLEKWVCIIFEGQVAPRYKWYWEREKGGRGEEWGGRGRWGEGGMRLCR